MKTKAVAVALLLVISAGYLAYYTLYNHVNTSQFSHVSSIQFLRNKLKATDPDSPDGQEIRRTLFKLREKQYAQLALENPDAFISALAELKTGKNGQRYGANYRHKELIKAKDFKAALGLRTKSLPWKSRGPGNVSGRGRSIAIDPSDPNGRTWFLATVGGGIWKTIDSGNQWEFLSPEMTTMSATSIVIAASNPDVIYVGTGMGYGRVVDLAGSGIWKSTDKGATWNQLESTANGELYEAINRIVVDPEDENILLVCSNNSYTSTGPNGGDRKSGIFRSVDGGSSWIQVFDPDVAFGEDTDNRVQQIIDTPGNFNILYASVNEVGVIKSVDGGITWTVSADNFADQQDIGFGEGTYSGISTRIELAIAPSDTNRIYASVEKPQGSAQLRMSKDAGETWTIVENNDEDINWHSAYGGSGADGAYTSGWFNNTIAVNPFDENIVFVGGVNLFRIIVDPTANTRSITPIAWWFFPNNFEAPWVHGDNHFLTLVPRSNSGIFRIICPNDGGIAYSPNSGITWHQRTGMITTQFYGVDKKPGEDVYIGGTQDNGTWISAQDPSESSTWTHVIPGDGFEAAWNYSNPDLIMGTSQYGNLYRSSDGGQSWDQVSEARKSGGPFISKIANSTSDPDLVFTVTHDGINRSDDFGDSWTETSLSPWIGYRPFSDVEVSDANPLVVWASSRIVSDTYNNTGGVYVSRDGGLSYKSITSNLPSYVVEPSGIATHPIEENIAYMLLSTPGTGKILRTVDFGETWEDITGFDVLARQSPTGFPDVAVFDLLVMPFDTQEIWAGTEIGLFISHDDGKTWTITDNGFPSVSVFDMKIRDNQVVIATYGQGIYTTEVVELENYKPPNVIKTPRLITLAHLPTGNVQITANLRSKYDSSLVVVDGNITTTLPENTEVLDTTFFLPVVEERTITAHVVGYLDGIAYSSASKELEVFVSQPENSYVNMVNDTEAEQDFKGQGFHVGLESGFDHYAIHTNHPYENNFEHIYQLKTPIIVADDNAIFRYSDIAIIEEGQALDHTDADFYDFVIVEGTKDGINWQPLAPGYDCRKDAIWLSAYQEQRNGEESMFRKNEIDLDDTFNAGDIIFIRFRLQSDAFVNGWGWAIDNIVIQSDILTSVTKPDQQVRIFPNPATERIYIKTASNLGRIEIVDLNGKILDSKDVIHPENENIEIHVGGFRKGIYIVNFYVDGEIFSTRFIKE